MWFLYYTKGTVVAFTASLMPSTIPVINNEHNRSINGQLSLRKFILTPSLTLSPCNLSAHCSVRY